MRYVPLSFFLVIIICFFSCEREYIKSSNQLYLSTDTLTLDTLVVGLLSETSKGLMLHNPSKEHVEGIEVNLNGKDSPFSINVNGTAGESFQHVHIGQKDSLFIFVQAKIPVLEDKDPFFFVFDSITIKSGTNLLKCILRVPIINAKHIEGGKVETLLWEKNQSYFIKDDIKVETGQTLVIEEGCSIFINNKANIIIEGAIEANGTLKDPVVFSGVRQGNLTNSVKYSQVSGLWDKIWIKPSAQKSNFNFCEIRNATTGILIGNSEINNVLTNVSITNSQMLYNSEFNLVSYNSKLLLANTVLSNAHRQFVIMGGNSTIIHATFANYNEWSNRGLEPITISDYDVLDKENTTPFAIDKYHMYNSIVAGYPQMEFDLNNEAVDIIAIENSLVQIDEFPDYVVSMYNIMNERARFLNTESFNYDFRLSKESPCINMANPNLGSSFPMDLDGNVRGGQSDIGAYEFVVKEED